MKKINYQWPNCALTLFCLPKTGLGLPKRGIIFYCERSLEVVSCVGLRLAENGSVFRCNSAPIFFPKWKMILNRCELMLHHLRNTGCVARRRPDGPTTPRSGKARAYFSSGMAAPRRVGKSGPCRVPPCSPIFRHNFSLFAVLGSVR